MEIELLPGHTTGSTSNGREKIQPSWKETSKILHNQEHRLFKHTTGQLQFGIQLGHIRFLHTTTRTTVSARHQEGADTRGALLHPIR